MGASGPGSPPHRIHSACCRCPPSRVPLPPANANREPPQVHFRSFNPSPANLRGTHVGHDPATDFYPPSLPPSSRCEASFYSPCWRCLGIAARCLVPSRRPTRCEGSEAPASNKHAAPAPPGTRVFAGIRPRLIACERHSHSSRVHTFACCTRRAYTDLRLAPSRSPRVVVAPRHQHPVTTCFRGIFSSHPHEASSHQPLVSKLYGCSKSIEHAYTTAAATLRLLPHSRLSASDSWTNAAVAERMPWHSPPAAAPNQ